MVTLKRISLGGLAEAQDGKFGDIILADVLTSYAKVIGDLFVSGCMFLSTKESSTGIPNRQCGGSLAVPLLISIPSMIRLRQCLIEFFRVRKGNRAVDGWGGQHLANALKYSTAFPVIILTAMQRGYDPAKIGMSQAGLHRLWILFSMINSFYTFYWDVAKDWDLNLFSAIADYINGKTQGSIRIGTPTTTTNGTTHSRHDPSSYEHHPFGLRTHRYFYANQIYYAAIAIDFILRFTWVSRLSVRINWINDLESGVFVLMFMEVIRRWIWIFFRVETEWVRNTRGPAPDDILLGEFNKLDNED